MSLQNPAANEAAKQAAAAQAAAPPPLNPPWPYVPTPFDPFAFGLNKDIDPKFLPPVVDSPASGE